MIGDLKYYEEPNVDNIPDWDYCIIFLTEEIHLIFNREFVYPNTNNYKNYFTMDEPW